MIRKCLSGLYAPADKTRILLTKLKDKLCHDKCFSRFLHPLKKFGAVKFRQRLICSWDSRHSVPKYWEFCAPTPPIKKNICIKKQTNKQKQTKTNETNKKKEQKQSNVFLIFKDRVIVSLFLIITINVLKRLHLNCRRFFITTVCRVLIYPRIWTFRRDTKEFRP